MPDVRAFNLQKTEDGFELSWAVNVMAPFLLTSLLLDNISGRIVNVSSISASSSLDFNNLQQV
jgi:NAD(P)-dependent dehydrogenase (short-subunit alcohol dehydrogenase family)